MRIRILALGLLAIGVTAAAPDVARAINTCNGLLTIDYKAQVKITHNRASYGYRVEAYGDMSAATDAAMSLQFYIGNQPTSAIHRGLWTRTSNGWVVRDLSR